MLLASSCTDPSDIGLELDPSNNQIGVFYTEIPLSASMVYQDSFNTTNPAVLIAGGDRSSFFGTTEAIGFSRLWLETSSAARQNRPRPGAVLDSAIFQFEIWSPSGKNFNQEKTLTVHRLQEPILDTSYYNFDRLAFDPQPFVRGSFRLQANRDTIVSVDLEEAFAAKIFGELQAGHPAYDDIFAFRNHFHGIAVQGNVEEDSNIPIRLGVNTGMYLYYTNPGDTVSRNIQINTSGSRRFNHVNNNRTGTPIEQIQQSNTPYQVGNLVGSKGNTGLFVKLDTSPLDQFLDTLGSVTFNQVILEVGPVEDFAESNRPFRGLMMEFWDNGLMRNHEGRVLTVQAENQPQQSVGPDGSIVPAASNPTFLEFRSDKELYSQGLTNYINAIYFSGLERTDLVLLPNVPPTSNLPNADFMDYRLSLREFKVNQNNIKLKIYYSKTR